MPWWPVRATAPIPTIRSRDRRVALADGEAVATGDANLSERIDETAGLNGKRRKTKARSTENPGQTQ